MTRRLSHKVVGVLLGLAFALSVNLSTAQAVAMSVQMAAMAGMEMGGDHDCGGCSGDQDKGSMKNGMCMQLCVSALAAILPAEPDPVRADTVTEIAVAPSFQLSWAAVPNPSPPRS